jgi:ABC-type multidrug transport system permease subunit
MSSTPTSVEGQTLQEGQTPRKGSDPDTPRRPRGGASHPLVELTLARFREFVREPEALFWTFLFPIVMSIAMALAFPASSGQSVRVGVPTGAAADALSKTLTSSPGVTVRQLPDEELTRALRNGDVHLVVVPGNPPTYRFDPVREESRVARLVVDDALKRASGRQDPWMAQEDTVAIPGSRYVDWLIPGIIALGIMNNSLWSIGFMTVQARLRKLLKRMAASPMQRQHFLLAPLLSRMVFLAPEVAVPLIFAALVFAMPIRGSVLDIAAVAVAGALSFGALGLLMGSRVRTFVASSGLMNLISVPMWVLSGVFFSATNFPEAVQPLIQVLPLTALVDAMRGVILEGAGLGGVSSDLAILAGWALAPFAIALRIFKWR